MNLSQRKFTYRTILYFWKEIKILGINRVNKSENKVAKRDYIHKFPSNKKINQPVP